MISWAYNGSMYIFGGIGHDGRTRDAYLDDMWNFKPSQYLLISLEGTFDWFQKLSAGFIFLVCISGIGGLAIVFCGALCLKKVYEQPSYSPNDFNVRYSRLTEQAEFET